MPVLSVLRSSLPIKSSLNRLGLNGLQLRYAHDRQMIIQPSRWSFHKFKDLLHFYVMLGVIPLTALVFFVNIYVGPAQLAPIPEDYKPKKWEFYRHPISRFMARFYATHQEEYEKFLQVMYEEHEQQQMRALEKKVYNLMNDLGDSKDSMMYRAPDLKWLKMVRDEYDAQREFKTDA